MKKLYTLASALLLAFTTLNAQQYDIAMTDFYPVGDSLAQSLPSNYADTIMLEITNFGSTIAAGNTIEIIFSFEINNQVQNLSLGSLVLPDSFASSTTAIIPSLVDWYSILSNFQGQNYEFCFTASLPNLIDINLANNQLCKTFSITAPPTTGSTDLGLVGILNPDTTQELPYNFYDTIVFFGNNFEDPLAPQQALNIEFTLTHNGSQIASFPYQLQTGQTVPSGAPLLFTSDLLDLSSLLSNFQGQQVTICCEISQTSFTDSDSTNNKLCYTYTVSSMTSVDGPIKKAIESAYYNQQLNIKNNQGSPSLYNLMGQKIYQENTIKSAYDINLKKGIYILNIELEGKIIHNNKISVQ